MSQPPPCSSFSKTMITALTAKAGISATTRRGCNKRAHKRCLDATNTCTTCKHSVIDDEDAEDPGVDTDEEERNRIGSGLNRSLDSPPSTPSILTQSTPKPEREDRTISPLGLLVNRHQGLQHQVSLTIWSDCNRRRPQSQTEHGERALNSLRGRQYNCDTGSPLPATGSAPLVENNIY